MTSYVLYGRQAEPPGRTLKVVSLREETEIRFAAARDDSTRLPVEIADDAVVALELDGGFELWLRGDELQHELGAEARDGGLTLKTTLGDGGTERGVGGWVVKALRILGIDPTDALVEKTAAQVEAANQNQLLRLATGSPEPWSAAAWQAGVIPPPPAPGDDGTAVAPEPVLLFVHGTFSSTLGSFGELFRLPTTLRALTARYGDRIFGFEHRTLTESPIANALALAELLPARTRLHLVSHSRGGLVGDLLCLGGLDEPAALLADDTLAALPERDRGDLRALVALLRERQIHVERFVRVASPSRGTTLASGRLDRWLSVMFHLLKQVPLLGGTLVDAVLELILAVVKQPQDADKLPGLAAMMPDAPLIGVLNRPDLRVAETARLAVIAGDIQETGWWGRLKLLLPDLFFAGDHDLVVNTGSMYGGLRRARGWFHFAQGEDINHFNYFGAPPDGADGPRTRPESVDALLLGLLGEPPGRFYQPLAEAPVSMPARRAAALTGRRQVLFVLPGVMGSSLAVRDADDEVWLSALRLMQGQLIRLRMDQPLPILPTGLIGLAYADLVRFMEGSHDVLPFPYDWRLSVRDAAAKLAEEVTRALDSTAADAHPVRILAHSMGGLVARAMIADHPGLWERIRARGGRLVMLGTPNRGSWEIVRLLVARASTLKLLALVDVPNGRGRLLDVIRDFPGVLELLPDARRDFFSAAVWQALRTHDEAEDWQLPGQGRRGADADTWLQQARATRSWLHERAVDPAGMIYVAGQAAETPSEVFETERRRFLGRTEKTLGFFASRRGDSNVLWDDGILPGVPTWYAPGMGHGDLASDERLFRALKDLLEQGETRERVLQRNPPVARDADARRELTEHDPAFRPDAATLARTALAMRTPRARAVPPRGEVAVSVIHGSLAFARHRVAVGHYQGDTIVAAEAYLDQVLDGRLSARHELGLYPGALGTHALFDHPVTDGKPPGALVVGLGVVGELTPSALTATFARALLGLARRIIEAPPPDLPRDDTGALAIAVSSLLIGTTAGGMSIRDSVLALLRGVAQANRTLERTGQAAQARITGVELVELWETRAIRAMHALRQIATDPELAAGFKPQVLLGSGDGGLWGCDGENADGIGDDPDWWHRLQVLAPDAGGLSFTFLTQRARAPESLVATQAQLVERFVARACAGTTYDAQVNLTLFEMLLPLRLKDGAELRNNLVLVLDEAAARYPWEMLEDRWSQPLSGEPAPLPADAQGERKPRAVSHGMLRQLKTQQGRERPVMAPGEGALVVGDPESDFVPLPGARAEAERVQAALGRAGFRVTSLIQRGVEAVVMALHADAYRILHLAGHGVHRERLDGREAPLCAACGQALPAREQARVSGMIIGPGMVLTPADVQQMRRVPELVFINCCHLGRTDGAAGRERESDRRQAPRLAANLAVAFIEMGVRAVVAAGWAVDDQAAQTFAEAFYRQMTAGLAFGEAVRSAREAAWREHPHASTWGAYQCYGDPDFRLQVTGHAGKPPAEPRYVAPAEVRAQLHNLRARARVAQPGELPTLAAELDRLQRALARLAEETGADWRNRGDVAEALGLAQGELGRFEDAAASLSRAIEAEDAGASWYAIEQRARHQARHAKALCQSDDTEAQARGRALFAAALATLERLERHPECKLTRQRFESRAAVHWRRVQTLPAKERAAELKAMIAVFEQAEAELARDDTDPLDPYSRLLWLAGKQLSTAYGKQELAQVEPRFADWCAELKRRARQYEARHRSILAGVIDIEVALLAHLAAGTLEGAADGLRADLAESLRRGVSRRQLDSVLDYVELLHVLAAGATHKKTRFRGQAAALEPILDLLRDWYDGAGAS